MRKVLLNILSLLLLTGCTDFLGKNPSVGKDEPIQTIDQLEGLVNSATVITYETNAIEVYGTDYCGITRSLYSNYRNKFDLANCYNVVHYVDGIASQASDAYWTGLYKNIFTANLILANIDVVSGDQSVKNRVKTDAYFLRAYNYWLLVNYYALPYTEANKDKPGVPLKLTTSFEEPMGRASIEKVYAQIESDIKEASKTEYAKVDPKLPWRVSKAAIDAFLSRYYLYRGDYAKAITYTDNAMGQGPELKDFNTLVAGKPASYVSPDVTLDYCETNDWAPMKFLYWPEHYYARFAYIGSQWRVPSESLISKYDKDNDLRFKWFFIKEGGRKFSVIGAYRYTIFYDGRYVPSGPSVAEIILNKAEAQVRTGQWQQGMQTLNILREKRMKAATYTPMTATDQADALKKVLDERSRELPYSCRWLDIRRFANNETPADDVELSVDFFETTIGNINVNNPVTYKVPVGSPLYAWPINGVEIDASKGQIIQNVY